MRRVHPIETESYRILRGMVDLSHLGPLSRAVAERVIHASADLDYAESLLLDEAALENGVSALRRDEPVVTDVGMVAAGITGRQTLCLVSDPRAQALSERLGITRSAAGFRLAAQEVGNQPGIEHPAADGRIARPVAQQGGRHRHHVDPVHLHGKNGGAVADMAVGDLRLYRNHVHAMSSGDIRVAGPGNLPRLTHWLFVCGHFHNLIKQGGTMSDVTIPGGRIRSFVERIENIDSELA